MLALISTSSLNHCIVVAPEVEGRLLYPAVIETSVMGATLVADDVRVTSEIWENVSSTIAYKIVYLITYQF